MSQSERLIDMKPVKQMHAAGNAFKNKYIRPLEPCDAEGMLEWMHDDSTASLFQRDFLSMQLRDVLEFIDSSQKNTESHHFAVQDSEGRYMGTVSLKNVDMHNLRAEYAISMRRCARGTGLASKGTKAVLRYAFSEIGLHCVYLNVLSSNVRARKFYEKNGFTFEGISKDAVFANDTYYDLYWYRILSNEFLAQDTNQSDSGS